MLDRVGICSEDGMMLCFITNTHCLYKHCLTHVRSINMYCYEPLSFLLQLSKNTTHENKFCCSRKYTTFFRFKNTSNTTPLFTNNGNMKEKNVEMTIIFV